MPGDADDRPCCQTDENLVVQLHAFPRHWRRWCMDDDAALTALLDDLHATEIFIDLRSCHNSFGDFNHSVFLALHLGLGEASDCFSVGEGDHSNTVGIGEYDV